MFISFAKTFAQEEARCVRINNFSVEERNQNYPFNKAARIVFASFEEDPKKLSKKQIDKLIKQSLLELDKSGKIEEFIHGSIIKMYFDELKNNFSYYDADCFEEKVDLNEEQKNEFTDLIFNFGIKAKDLGSIGSGCYTPRNAVLFFDENNQLFGFLEICFQCNGFRKSSKNIDLYDECGEKLYLLKDQFAKAGIQYGVKKK
ncbi:hypothetical protein [Paenimyroides aestuarii]|uniref:Uncharacterized protein n=1 Tax=Paenimyroides aestuarii TaxID=2968490 RepID=A0ABY5NQJ0_9FLAO|nr:hypothetical protein [Paenimyroides aestuarii]UUV20830.1 hypothetical protein NPX36_10945 [Paenimyroides aestuarii]